MILLDGNPIHWCSRCQPITAVSSTEAEYIALAECAKEVLWVSHLIQQLTGRALQNTPTIHVDNQAAIHCANNGIHNSHIKHLSIRYYFIKQCVDDILFTLLKIHTKLIPADGFTKPLTQPHYNNLFTKLMTINLETQ